ncbi:MAG: DUF6054 family protein [Micrococcales bacterium]|nr:DUF6054 family protein [Micrococcales bacterium]
MARVEYVLYGNFDDIVAHVTQGVLDGSLSASLEDGSDIRVGRTRCALRVFERYSMMEKGPVSLSVVMVGGEEGVHLSAIPAGGDQGLLGGATIGEKRFLDTLPPVVEAWQSQHSRPPAPPSEPRQPPVWWSNSE